MKRELQWVYWFTKISQTLKGKIVSSFARPHVVPKLCNFLLITKGDHSLSLFCKKIKMKVNWYWDCQSQTSKSFNIHLISFICFCFHEQWGSGILSCDWDQSCDGQACRHMGQHRHHGRTESGANANCEKAYRCKLCLCRHHIPHIFRLYTYS